MANGDGQNFLSVLAKAGQAGLGFVGANLAQARQQERLNQFQQQQQQQQLEAFRKNMLISDQKIKEGNIKLQQLSMSPEERLTQQAQAQQSAFQNVLGGLSQGLLPEGGLPPAGGFVGPPTPIGPGAGVGEQLGALQASLPSGVSVPVSGTPVTGVDRAAQQRQVEKAQADLELTRAKTTALTTKTEAGPTGARPKTLSVENQRIEQFFGRQFPDDPTKAADEFAKYLSNTKDASPKRRATSLLQSKQGNIVTSFDPKVPQELFDARREIIALTGVDFQSLMNKQEMIEAATAKFADEELAKALDQIERLFEEVPFPEER